jgi:hypothetical protein
MTENKKRSYSSTTKLEPSEFPWVFCQVTPKPTWFEKWIMPVIMTFQFMWMLLTDLIVARTRAV